MKSLRSSLSLPVRMALPVVAVGALCTVALGLSRYAEAVRAEGDALERFVHAAGQAVGATELSFTREPSAAQARIAEGLRGLRGNQAVKAWRVLASDGGEEILRSPYASSFEFEQIAALDHALVWMPGPGGDQRLREAALRENLVIRLPFAADRGTTHIFEAVIDGPARHRAALRQIAQQLVPTAAGFFILSLLVFAMAYRWVSRPLAKLQASLNQTPEHPETSDRLPGPFGVVHRELHELRAFADINSQASYALADASSQALLSIDLQGVIQHGNRAAARLLSVGAADQLVGRSLTKFFDAESRSAFERLLNPRNEVVRETRTVQIRLQPSDTDGDPTSAPISLSVGAFDPQTHQAGVVLQPRSRGDALQERLSQQQRLLQSAIDESPEPWALTDGQGRVQLVNRAWVGQTRQAADTLVQSDLSEPGVWAAWGAASAQQAAARVSELLRDAAATTEPITIETPDGPRLLEGRRCQTSSATGAGTADGVVWTLREAVKSSDEASLSSQGFGAASEVAFSDLREARTTPDLLDAAVEAIRRLADAPAAGIAIRAAGPTGQRRSDQRLTVGGTSLPLRAYTELRACSEADLMPAVMGGADPFVRFGESDTTTEWDGALQACGLGASVAVKLSGLGEELGVIWAASAPGETVGPERIEALRRAAELIGVRLDALRLGESFQTLGLLDAVTGLPTTPAMLRHLHSLPPASHFTTPNHVLAFTLGSDAKRANRSQREAFASLAADCLRARCRRNVFIASIGPTEFAVAVHAMGTQHAESLGDRLLGALRDLPLGESAVGDCLSVGRVTVPADSDEAAAASALKAARDAALENRSALRAAS
ncbi:MAG: PAS domain-containing protein [Planctomycetota bacterium]